MKNIQVPLLFSVVLALSITFLIYKKRHYMHWDSYVPNTLETDSLEPVIGTYHKDGVVPFRDSTALTHIRIKLNRAIDEDFLETVKQQLSTDRTYLISIEILPAPGLHYSRNKNLLREIVNREYDPAIKALCGALRERATARPVYLRWNPEMEVPVRVYPWQYKSPALYIKSFRHLAGLTASCAPGARIAWGAAGYSGAEEYWPGDDVVDLITLTVGGKSERLARARESGKITAQNISRKIHRVRFMNRPVVFLLGQLHASQPAQVSASLDSAIAAVEHQKDIVYGTIGLGPLADKPHSTIGKPKIGVYDPKEVLLNCHAVNVEHIFVDLANIRDGSCEKQLRRAAARNHDIILSVEPWRNVPGEVPGNVLQQTLEGRYDVEFRMVYEVIASLNQTVYLRFAHEMEIPITRYAWQSQDPVLYIKAYRYFMNFKPTGSTNIKRLWGPAGDRGSMEWWPGADVVDYISIAIFGLPDINITDPARQESFSTIYLRKKHRFRFTGKPIFITESGVKGPPDFQSNWLINAAMYINKHPEIYGLCYFNLVDNPKVWGNIPAPDWGISKETFNHFVQTLDNRLASN